MHLKLRKVEKQLYHIYAYMYACIFFRFLNISSFSYFSIIKSQKLYMEKERRRTKDNNIFKTIFEIKINAISPGNKKKIFVLINFSVTYKG